MKYRKFGKIGEVSALGFGCMRLPEVERGGVWTVDEEKAVPMLRKAVDLGVNYFDTAVGYCHENSQKTVGKALKPVRDKVMIATKIPLSEARDEGYFRRMLEQSLERLDTPYIDCYHFHGINKSWYDGTIVKFGFMRAAQRAIDEGLIRHISFSFHGDPEEMGYIIEKGEIFSSVLCQYNVLDRRNEEQIASAREKGLGVVVMGPVGGGRLGAPSELYKKLTGKDSGATPELALRFVLGNENVSCALSGMQNEKMLEENAAVAANLAPFDSGELSRLSLMLDEIKKFEELYCTGCDYCLPCPQGIKISQVFQLYNLHSMYGLTSYAKERFASHAATVDTCIECGECSAKCPQRLDVPELLKKSADALG